MKAVDYAAMTEKRCSACGEVKPVDQFNRKNSGALHGWSYSPDCKRCSRERSREYGRGNKARRNARLRQWRLANPDAAKALDRRRRLRKYSLSEGEWQAMVDRYAGQCWVCRCRPAVLIEHDHLTGQVRGAACPGCNAVLAKIDHDPMFLANLCSYLDGVPRGTSPVAGGAGVEGVNQ